MITHNRMSQFIHKKMVDRGYYKTERELPSVIMLMMTEVVKLYDDNKLNKNEKIADLAMRLYDYCGWQKIRIVNDIKYDGDIQLLDITTYLTNEVEAFRSGVVTKGLYIQLSLGYCYAYAEANDIDLQYEIIRKCKMLKKIRNTKKM